MSKRQSRSQKKHHQRKSKRVQRSQKKRRDAQASEARSQTKSAQVSSRDQRFTRVNAELKSRRSRLTAWYLGLSTAKKVILGLIVIPLIIALILLQGVIFPFLAGVFGIVLAISKSAIVFVKGGAFIVYISYKVFKGLLGVYLCVSRSLNGLKAHRLRQQQATQAPSPTAEYPAVRYDGDSSEIPLEISSGFKKLSFSTSSGLNQTMVFSYLRYFIFGQIFMYLSFWRDRGAYLTIWRAESRERVKEIFKQIGQTIFSPHQLGPYLGKRNILVPGDARLIALTLSPDSERVTYELEVTWRERAFQRKKPYFTSSAYQATWEVSAPLKLGSLSTDEVGYRKEVCGAPITCE